MRVRNAFIIIALTTAITGCSASSTAPIECDGNPKCKADLLPVVPAPVKLQPATAPTAPAAAKLGESRPS
jgi:hypothetical protein